MLRNWRLAALAALDLDRAVAWGLLGKAWIAGAGLATALLIALHFSPVVQGYHFAFMTFLGVQIFVELGLSLVIVVFASHESAHLRLDSLQRVGGDPVAVSRLAGIARLGFCWFGIGGGLYALGLLATGSVFFGTGEAPGGIDWRGPWTGLSIAAGANLCLIPFWALLTGCQQTVQVNMSRCIEAIVRSIAIWIAILLGANLWSAAIAMSASWLWGVAFLVVRYRKFFASLLGAARAQSVSWKREILPMQWRIALSSVGGLLLSSTITLVVFKLEGPAAAGQMGMTWTVIGGISMLASTWAQARQPLMAQLAARSRFAELDRLSWRTGKTACLISAAGAVALAGLLALAQTVAPAVATRLLAPVPVLVLGLSEALHQVYSTETAYLRAFKRDPLMFLSIAVGFAFPAATILATWRLGVWGATLAYFAAIALLTVRGTIAFVRLRRDYHSAAASASTR